MKWWASLVALLVSLPLLAATYYVDFATGSDGNNGTATGTPFKHCPGHTNATSTAAGTTLSAGDTVKFKGGIYYTGNVALAFSGTAGSPIIYDGNHTGDWGTGRAVMDGAYAYAGGALYATANRQNITIQGFEIARYAGYAPDSAAVTNAANGTTTNTTSTLGQGVSLYEGSTNIILNNLYVHEIGGWRNTIGWAAATVSGGGIILKSPHGATITNCEITKAHTAIGLYADTTLNQVEVANCNLHDYIVWGVDLATFQANSVVRDVNIHDTSIHDYAQFTLGNWLGSDETPHTDGIFIRTAGVNGTVWSNINVFNMNFYCDNPGSSQGGTASIFISEGPSVNIWNCLFNYDIQTRAIGIAYDNPGSRTNVVRIYNNTFITYSAAIIMDTEADPNERQVYIQNNIFRMNAGSAQNNTMFTQLTGVEPAVMNNNLYYDPDWNAAQKYVWATAGVTYTLFGDVFSSFGFEEDGLYANPLFTSFGATPSTRNLRLVPGSPAIGAGANLSAFFTTDKNGNTRTVPWDIGAYKFIGSTWNVTTLNATTINVGQ